MLRSVRTLTGACALLAAVAITAQNSRGDRYWGTNGNGDFNDTANWSATNGGALGASAPDLTQPTFFQLSGASPYTVSFAANGASNTVTVENNRLTLDVNTFEYAVGDSATPNHHIYISSTGAGNSASLTLSDGAIRVGQIPSVANGTTVSSTFFVHGATGSAGAVARIDGPTATIWGGQLNVGSRPSGSPNSDAANTRLEIINGGKANFISGGSVGSVAGGRGTLNVDGLGSQISLHSLQVGGNATGSLNITNNGVVTIQSPGTSLNNGGYVNWSLGTTTIDATGVMEIQGGLAQNPNFVAASPSDVRNRNEFRDAGTIRKITGTSDRGRFVNIADRVNNQIGKFRPGDTSATPAVGTAFFENVTFTNQTDSSDPLNIVRARLYMDLASPTSFDRIILTDPDNTAVGPVAAVLGGEIIFADPIGGISFNTVTYMDLIVGEQIFDTGYISNLAAVAADWTYNGLPANAWLGIANVSGGQALRLTVVPEPVGVSALMLGMTGLLMHRRNRRGNR